MTDSNSRKIDCTLVGSRTAQIAPSTATQSEQGCAAALLPPADHALCGGVNPSIWAVLAVHQDEVVQDAWPRRRTPGAVSRTGIFGIDSVRSPIATTARRHTSRLKGVVVGDQQHLRLGISEEEPSLLGCGRGGQRLTAGLAATRLQPIFVSQKDRNAPDDSGIAEAVRNRRRLPSINETRKRNQDWGFLAAGPFHGREPGH